MLQSIVHRVVDDAPESETDRRDVAPPSPSPLRQLQTRQRFEQGPRIKMDFYSYQLAVDEERPLTWEAFVHTTNLVHSGQR